MNNEIKITFKQFLIILLLLILVTLLIDFSLSISINYLKKNTEIISSIVGGFGNVIGGIIGGIVAYIVAAYQINRNVEIENKNQNSHISSLLRLMKAEIQHNLNIMEKCKNDFDKGNNLPLLKTLSTSFWERSSHKIAEKVPEETISKMIEYSIKTNAVKSSVGKVPIALSDELIKTFHETIDLIDKCISDLSHKK